MLRIPCPHCGLRDYTEFLYAGDATKQRPAHGTSEWRAWYEHVFLFNNPKGAHREYWQHVQGLSTVVGSGTRHFYQHGRPSVACA